MSGVLRQLRQIKMIADQIHKQEDHITESSESSQQVPEALGPAPHQEESCREDQTLLHSEQDLVLTHH